MKVGYTTGIRGMEIRYGPWEDQVKPSGDHIPGNTVVNETFDPMYEPSLLLSYLTWAVKTICSRRLANLTINFCLCEASTSEQTTTPMQTARCTTLQVCHLLNDYFYLRRPECKYKYLLTLYLLSMAINL